MGDGTKEFPLEHHLTEKQINKLHKKGKLLFMFEKRWIILRLSNGEYKLMKKISKLKDKIKALEAQQKG